MCIHRLRVNESAATVVHVCSPSQVKALPVASVAVPYYFNSLSEKRRTTQCTSTRQIDYEKSPSDSQTALLRRPLVSR